MLYRTLPFFVVCVCATRILSAAAVAVKPTLHDTCFFASFPQLEGREEPRSTLCSSLASADATFPIKAGKIKHFGSFALLLYDAVLVYIHDDRPRAYHLPTAVVAFSLSLVFLSCWTKRETEGRECDLKRQMMICELWDAVQQRDAWMVPEPAARTVPSLASRAERAQRAKGYYTPQKRFRAEPPAEPRAPSPSPVPRAGSWKVFRIQGRRGLSGTVAWSPPLIFQKPPLLLLCCCCFGALFASTLDTAATSSFPCLTHGAGRKHLILV